jgi:regulatory protein
VATRKTKLLDQEALMNYALRLMGGRDHSMGELREKMGRRAERPESIERVIAKLKEAGYVDDRKFAENYAAARLENEGFGKMRVLRDLRQRRVAPQLAEQVTERIFQSTDETELIEAFLKRKFRGKQLGPYLKDSKNLAAAYRRLRYAGYSSGASIRVLKRYSNQAEELDGLETEEPES